MSLAELYFCCSWVLMPCTIRIYGDIIIIICELNNARSGQSWVRIYYYYLRWRVYKMYIYIKSRPGSGGRILYVVRVRNSSHSAAKIPKRICAVESWSRHLGTRRRSVCVRYDIGMDIGIGTCAAHAQTS